MGVRPRPEPTAFRTGWFIEGLLTQLLVVLVLRARTMPWQGARPTRVVVIAAMAAATIGAALPLTPLAAGLTMQPPPIGYKLWLIGVIAVYGLAT